MFEKKIENIAPAAEIISNDNNERVGLKRNLEESNSQPIKKQK